MVKNVLGVRIDDISQQEVLDEVLTWIESKEERDPSLSRVNDSLGIKTKLIFTPGPEFLVTAQNDLEFKEILNSSDLNVPDGFGLHFAGIQSRVPGVDLMLALCKLAQEQKWSVGLLGGRGNVAERAAKKLQEKYPDLKISYAISDEEADKIVSYYFIDNSITIPIDRIDKNIKSYPTVDLLFVGFGHPKQEKLLSKILNSKSEIPNGPQNLNSKKNKISSLEISNFNLEFRVGVGVGGSFDLIVGSKKRAPKIFQTMGLEWLWRIFQDPKHIVRVWSAIGKFLYYLYIRK